MGDFHVISYRHKRTTLSQTREVPDDIVNCQVNSETSMRFGSVYFFQLIFELG